jgi:hypothetical protein
LFFGFLILAFFGSLTVLLWTPPSPSDRELTEDELRVLSSPASVRSGGVESPSATTPRGALGAEDRSERGSATLAVTTEPSGADVSIDGEVVGVTPLRQDYPSSRWYAVTVERAAYGTVDTLVYLDEGEAAELAFSFSRLGDGRDEPKGAGTEDASGVDEPASPSAPTPRREVARAPREEAPRAPRSAPAFGSISVRTNPTDAPVRLDGQTVGVAPLELDEVAPGPHTLTLFLPGYETATVQLDVTAGEREVVDVDLVPQQGTLSVVVRPWGSVYVDGVLRAADTDVSVEMTLPVGRHALWVEHPSLGAEERVVIVQPRTTTSVVLDLN